MSTFIYESAIETHTQYDGQGTDVLREYGTDRAELTRRHHDQAARIAPESAWDSDLDGSATVKVDGIDYVGYIRRVELVC